MTRLSEKPRACAVTRPTTAGRTSVISLMLALLATCCVAQAQVEPRVPCNDCPERTIAPKPETGLWNNPLNPTGSGLMLEVQGQKIAGFHFGYEESGQPLWLLLSGVLEPAPEESNALWVLESPLHRFADGPCLNCPAQQAVADGSDGTVTIEFLSRNHARFRIDDGPWKSVVSFAFGAPTENPFAEVSDLRLPDLEGRWALVLQDTSPEGFSNKRTSRGSAQLVRLIRLEPEPGEESVVRYRISPTAEFSIIGTPPPEPAIGTIECTGNEDIGPLCTVELNDDNKLQPEFGALTLSARLSDISDSRWTAFDRFGRDIQAFRVDYD